MRRIVIVALLLIVLAAGAWWYASPLWTLRQMREAARAHDAAKLSRYVDYPALRADVKGDLERYATSRVGLPAEDRGPFAALARIFVGSVVDATVTPEGVTAMFAAQGRPASSPSSVGQPTGKPMPVSAPDHPVIDRDGLDGFRVRDKNPAKGALVFHREGLGWKLVGVDLPTSGG